MSIERRIRVRSRCRFVESEAAGGTAARGVFPFGLAGKAITLAGARAQPLHVTLRIFPVHVDHRPLAAAPAMIVGPIPRTAAARDARVPLVERYFVPAQRETAAAHLAHRCL